MPAEVTAEVAAYDEVGQIMKYEQDLLGYDDSIVLFQRLVNSGLAWKLQGHYGRTATALINLGHVTSPVPRGWDAIEAD